MNNEKQQKEQIFRLKIKLAVLRYVIVNLFLVFVNWITTPNYWWVFWVIAGWGLGLVLNLINQYMMFRVQSRYESSRSSNENVI